MSLMRCLQHHRYLVRIAGFCFGFSSLPYLNGLSGTATRSSSCGIFVGCKYGVFLSTRFPCAVPTMYDLPLPASVIIFLLVVPYNMKFQYVVSCIYQHNLFDFPQPSDFFTYYFLKLMFQQLNACWNYWSSNFAR